MRRALRYIFLAFVALILGISQSAAATAGPLHWINQHPLWGVFFAVIGGTVILLLSDLQSIPPPVDEATLRLHTQRVNLRTTSLAEAHIALADDACGLVAFNPPHELAPGTGAEPTPVDLRALVIGPPGAGKTTFLAQLAKSYAASTLYPVILLALGEWVKDWRREDDTSKRFQAWCVSRVVHDYAVSPAVAAHWMWHNNAVLLLDGLDELNYKDRELLARQLGAFLNDPHHNGLRVIVACRQDEYEELTAHLPLQAWPIPLLDRATVADVLRDSVPDFLLLSSRSANALIDSCRVPFWLVSILEVGLTDAEPQLSVDAWRQAILQRLSAARFGTQDTSLFRIARWIARALSEEQQGTSLDLATLNTFWIPAAYQRFTRLLQASVLLPVFGVYCLVIARVTDSGTLGVVVSGGYVGMVGLLFVGRIGRYFTRWRSQPRIVSRRYWSPIRLRERLWQLRKQFITRCVIGVLIGTAVGLVLGMIRNLGNDDWTRTPVTRLILIASIPVLLGAFGALGGGLLSGLAGCLAFGVDDSISRCLLGGIVAGVTALLLFGIVDLGERTEPFALATVRTAPADVSQRLRRSWLVNLRFDAAAWLVFGCLYGVVIYFANASQPQWLLFGLLVGAGGAAMYAIMATVWPWVTLRSVEAGLRRSAVLDDASLNDGLTELQRRRVLVGTAGGTALRFSHPLFQRFVAASDEDGER